MLQALNRRIELNTADQSLPATSQTGDQTTAYARIPSDSNTMAPGQPVTMQAGIFSPNGQTLPWLGGITLVTALMTFWLVARQRPVNSIRSPGFEVITPSEKRRFIPLTEKFHQLDFLANVETRGQLRLSANLNKVGLSQRRYGYLLEDKNYRNALLVNRRRMRRTLLKDGDVLDLGDLTLLYRDNRPEPGLRLSGGGQQEGKVFVRFERLRGPVQKGTPMFAMEQPQSRNFYLTKNMVFIGRSENNDLVVKANGVAYRHAKVERIGSRYKLTDLNGAGNTFINNRRVEQKTLKEGDEITLGFFKFKFLLSNAPVRESFYAKPTVLDTAEISSDEDLMEDENDQALAQLEDASTDQRADEANEQQI